MSPTVTYGRIWAGLWSLSGRNMRTLRRHGFENSPLAFSGAQDMVRINGPKGWSAAGRAMNQSRIWLLKHRPLVHQLKDSAWRRLLQAGEAWDCVRGQILCGPDDEGALAYLVRAGRVRLCRFGPDGHEIVAGILEEGDLFGQRAREEGPAAEGYAETLSDQPRPDFEGRESARPPGSGESTSAWSACTGRYRVATRATEGAHAHRTRRARGEVPRGGGVGAAGWSCREVPVKLGL